MTHRRNAPLLLLAITVIAWPQFLSSQDADPGAATKILDVAITSPPPGQPLFGEV